MPDSFEKLIPGYQLIGTLGKTDKNIHHLGFKVLGLAIWSGYGSPQWFNTPRAEPESLSEIGRHYGHAKMLSNSLLYPNYRSGATPEFHSFSSQKKAFFCQDVTTESDQNRRPYA